MRVRLHRTIVSQMRFACAPRYFTSNDERVGCVRQRAKRGIVLFGLLERVSIDAPRIVSFRNMIIRVIARQIARYMLRRSLHAAPLACDCARPVYA